MVPRHTTQDHRPEDRPHLHQYATLHTMLAYIYVYEGTQVCMNVTFISPAGLSAAAWYFIRRPPAGPTIVSRRISSSSHPLPTSYAAPTSNIH